MEICNLDFGVCEVWRTFEFNSHGKSDHCKTGESFTLEILKNVSNITPVHSRK